MKFLIYGHKGWIGKQVINYLNNTNILYVCGNARVNNKIDVENEIRNLIPTHIISLIGRTHGKIDGKVYSTIDYLEQDGKVYDNVRDNLFSPLVLALICKKCNIHFTYLGTGCIFVYDNNHPFGKDINGFTEDSLPNFVGSSYSIVKGFTDEIMHMFDHVLNMRIRMPITDVKNPRNFITKITTYEKICSIPNSMTVLNDIIPIMINMASKNKKGTYNMVNPGLISHNEILEMYKEIVDPYFEWKNFTVDEQDKILASKRSNNFLDTSKLENEYEIKNIKDSVRDILLNYN